MIIERDNARSMVRLPAVFSTGVTAEFLKYVKGEIEKGTIEIGLDFKATRLVDSAAIGTLVSVAKDCRANGTRLALCNLNEEIKDLFVQTSFDKIFTIESEEGVHPAESDIFENAVDIRLYIEKESVNDICILHLNGVMNNPEGSRLFKQEFLLAMAHYKKILVDFLELTFFDSLSISVVLNMNRLLKETGGSMRICGPNEIISELFKTLNIQKIIPFFSTREEALKDWE
jgi:anti-sigma B factor antagonist